jgi:hypothetical protein
MLSEPPSESPMRVSVQFSREYTRSFGQRPMWDIKAPRLADVADSRWDTTPSTVMKQVVELGHSPVWDQTHDFTTMPTRASGPKRMPAFLRQKGRSYQPALSPTRSMPCTAAASRQTMHGISRYKLK